MRRDMMPGFALYAPRSLGEATEIADAMGADGWLMAGGQDSLDWFKDRVKRPPAVIDLSGVAELRGVRDAGDSVSVGALTTLSEISRDPLIKAGFPVLSDAARHVASPQIRNIATLGGNLMQDARCWYYREGLSCYRAGGNTCFANTPQGANREHCIFGADRCIAVSPSDTATALVALDATMRLHSVDGVRAVPAGDFFWGPSSSITAMTCAKKGEVLGSIEIPKRMADLRHHFEKVADRQAFDFALASIAALWTVDGGVLRSFRAVAGGVECVPRRLHAVESAVLGRAPDADTAERAAAAAVEGARAVRHNGYKVTLLANLVRRVIREAAKWT